jgi:F-type H+-transporting ATPase subunit delta
MKITKKARREAKELFAICLVKGLLDEPRTRQVVQRVLEVKPRGYLAILSHFQRLVKLHLDGRTARIDSAVALEPAMQAALHAQLDRQYGPGLIYSYHQDPALIGGLRVRVGCDVYDGSIRARLNALEEAL